MLAWLGALKEALSLVNNLTDPDKRKKAYKLHLRKKSNKALEYAEKTYHLLDDNLWNEPSMKKSKIYRKYKYYKKVFFQND